MAIVFELNDNTPQQPEVFQAAHKEGVRRFYIGARNNNFTESAKSTPSDCRKNKNVARELARKHEHHSEICCCDLNVSGCTTL